MYTDIKSFEDACAAQGIDPNKLPVVEGLPEEFATPNVNIYKLMVISKAVRGGWVPDYNNSGQDKYEAWIDLEEEPNNPSGFRFDCSIYSVSYSGSILGPLLCQATREQAKYLVTEFEDLWRSVMKPKK